LTKDERTGVSENDKKTKEPARRKVKVTDRRHAARDSAGVASTAAESTSPEPRIGVSGGSSRSAASAGEPGVDRGGGSSTSEASRRSETHPDEGEPRAHEVAQLREHLQRLAADFDNYRKRILKEQTRAVEMASEPLVRRLLEVLDEFDLALMAAEKKPDFDTFLHGVELVYAKLLETLRAEGLERMVAEGKPFDPTLHEALMQSGDAEGEPIVADTLRPGYTLRGRVIRPAGVKVVRK
jgi:molecular chaperone GrpE